MTLSRPVLAVGGALLIALALLVLWPAQRVSPSEQVRRQVVQAARAAEEKKLSTLMDQVSERFRMDNGADKADLKRLLAARLLPEQWLRVFLVDLSATETSGGVDLAAKVIFGNSKATTLKALAANSTLQGYAINARYELEEGGHWRAVSADAKPISPQDLVSLSP